MAPGKGYILMTDFTTHPAGFPSIGTIIQDSFRPTERRLSVPSEQPKTLAHSDTYRQVRTSEFELHGDVWAKFCQTIDARLSGGVANKTYNVYEAKRLDTSYMVAPPTDREANERAKESEVKAVMEGWSGKPVFMVTGLKVARGFKRTTQVAKTQSGEASIGAQVTPDAAVGGGIGVAHGTALHEQSQSLKGDSNDIVFAYKLHIITRKGWLKKGVDVRPYEPSGGFSSVGAPNDETEVVEASPFTIEDILRVARDNEERIQQHKATEKSETGEEEEVLCIEVQDV